MTPGLGQPFLPRPQFHSSNPYWIDPAKNFGFMAPEYRPRRTAQDFLYATAWELTSWDVVGACFVREAMQRSFWIGLRVNRLNYKEIEKHEKVA